MLSCLCGFMCVRVLHVCVCCVFTFFTVTPWDEISLEILCLEDVGIEGVRVSWPIFDCSFPALHPLKRFGGRFSFVTWVMMTFAPAC